MKNNNKFAKIPKMNLGGTISDIGLGLTDTVLGAAGFTDLIDRNNYSTQNGKKYNNINSRYIAPITQKATALGLQAVGVPLPLTQALQSVGTGINSTIDTDQEKSDRNRLAMMQTQGQYINPNITRYEDGGIINSSVVNIEKDELEVKNGKIIRDFKDRPAHPKYGINPEGTVLATAGNYIIPNDMREDYMKGDIYKRASMEREVANRKINTGIPKAANGMQVPYASTNNGFPVYGTSFDNLVNSQVDNGVYDFNTQVIPQNKLPMQYAPVNSNSYLPNALRTNNMNISPYASFNGQVPTSNTFDTTSKINKSFPETNIPVNQVNTNANNSTISLLPYVTDNITNAILNEQLPKIPKPNLFNPTYVNPNINVNTQLNDIERGRRTANESLKNNTSNSSILRSNMLDLYNKSQSLRNEVFADKNNKELNITMGNTNTANQAKQYNNQLIDRFNTDNMQRSQDYNTNISKNVANLQEDNYKVQNYNNLAKADNLASMKATDETALAYKSILSGMSEVERNKQFEQLRITNPALYKKIING